MKKNGISSHLLKMAFSSTLLFSSSAWAATFNVTSTADSGPNTLRNALSSLTGNDTINIILPNNSIITCLSNLPPINTSTLTIDATGAQNLTISGNNLNQVFFIESGNVTYTGNATSGTTITGAKVVGATGGSATQGGGGGGGGAGAGSALFINDGSSATFNNVSFLNNNSTGGNGGNGGAAGVGGGGGGGGGFTGGASVGTGGGGNINAGGGGGGGFPNGGNGGLAGAVGSPGGAGTLVGGGGGGGGEASVGAPASGGTGALPGNNGGAGGNATTDGVAGSGTGGGGGSGLSIVAGAGGPNGGGGGGGGGGVAACPGAVGGLGGGGGGGNSQNAQGGVAGFGGGGGGGGGSASGGTAAIGGAGGAGNGAGPYGGGGGGGAGLGGAVFVHQNATLTMGQAFSFTGNSSTGGSGGTGGGGIAQAGFSGAGLGADIFAIAGGTLAFNIPVSQTVTFTNPIKGFGPGVGTSGGGLILNGPGTLVLNGVNTYFGGTTINGGTFRLGAGATILGSMTLTGGTLDLSTTGGTVTLNNLSGGAAATIALGATDLAVNMSQDSTFSGTITGTGAASLTVQGTNTLTLAGTGSTYGGGTTIAETATCAIADNGSLGASGSTVTFGTAGTDDSTLQIGATELTEALGANIALDKNMALTGKGNVNLQSNNVTHTGTTSGNKQLVVRGRASSIPPALIVKNAWAHTGGTRLSRNASPDAADGFGTNLVLQGNMASLPTNGDLTMDDGTNFDMSDGTIPGAAQTLGNLNGTGDIQVGDNTLNLNLTADAQYDGNITDGATALVGTGTLVVNGPNKRMIVSGTNTQSGGTKLKSVALAFCNDVNLGGTNVALQMGVAGADLPELQAFCSQVIMSRGANLVADKNVIALAGNQLTHQGSVATTGPGKLHITGTNPLEDAPGGIYRVKAPMQHTGNTALEGGTLLMDGSTATLPLGKDVDLATGTLLDISPTTTPDQSIGAMTGAGRAQIDRKQMAVNPTADATFDGPIRGSGGRIRKSGGNKWSLSNTHTYDGGTFIDDGTIAIITNGLLPPTGDVTIGANAAEGIVEIANPKLDISAANNDQTIGALSGNGRLTLGNTRRMITQSIKEARFEGIIEGGVNSNFTKDGTGGLTLAGTSTTTGTIDVTRGRMIIDSTGNTQTALTRVNAAGTLKGTGRAGHVQNSGFVTPGKSIGTLTTSDYEESGTLQIEVNPTQNSVLAVIGDMTINPGSTLLVAPDPGAYASTQTYTVVTVTGAGTGTYSTVASTNPLRFKPTAIYNGFALADVGLVDPFIQIVLDVVPFANIIKGGNAGAVAKCFDTVSVNSCSDIGTVIQVLDNMSCTCSLSELREAFNEMQPSQYGALALAQENNDILVRAAITHRLDQVYPIDCEKQNTAPVQQPGYYQNTSENIQTVQQTPKKDKGNVWFAPMGKYANQGNQQHNPGYHQASGGILLGTDYEISDSGYLGTAVAYTFTDVNLKKSSGKADINSYYGTVYGNWFSKRVFIDAAFIGAYNHYHAKRRIGFIDRTARNGHNGYQLAGSLGTGMLFTPDQYQIQPYARADYVYLHQGAYKEHGARCLNLKIEEKNSQYIRTDLGVKVAYCYKSEKLKYIPYFKASWIWEKQIDEGHLKAHFLASDCTFTVTGLAPHRSLFAPSMGLTILAHEDAFSFAIQYDAEVGHRFWENRAYLNFGFRY
jgi:autotransporter-associated beta strand protein